MIDTDEIKSVDTESVRREFDANVHITDHWDCCVGHRMAREQIPALLDDLDATNGHYKALINRLVAPEPNLGGTDWDWTDVEGNEFNISEDGSVMVTASDDWVDLNGDQWAQVAAVALLMSERLGTAKSED